MHDFGAKEGLISDLFNLVEELSPHLDDASIAKLTPQSRKLLERRRAQMARTLADEAKRQREERLRDQAKAKLSAEEIAALRL